MIPALNRFSSAALSSRSYADVSHRVFVTPRRVRFVESEYAVPRESLLHVLGELRRQVPRLAGPVMFPVEVRVAAADDIWLSRAYGRDTAHVAIRAVDRLRGIVDNASARKPKSATSYRRITGDPVAERAE